MRIIRILVALGATAIYTVDRADTYQRWGVAAILGREFELTPLAATAA